MSEQPNTATTPNPTTPAPGDATNPNATATSLSTPQVNATPAPAANTPQSSTGAQQPSDNSNAPDAQTPAAKSIPQNLINNPAAPTQKMAAIADANKNSPAPEHSRLYDAAVAMTGGPRYTTSYDTEGNVTRTQLHPPLAALGLALALNVLSGGLQGMAATGPGRFGKAAQIGAEAGQKQVAAIQNANAQQDAQAKADQNHKLSVTKSNLETHQLAMNVGKQGLEMNQAYVDGYKDTANMLEHHRDLIKDDVPEDKIQDAMKKYNVTADMFIPHGDPVALMDPTTGKQREDANHVPLWTHNYYVIDAKGKGVLTQELQDMMYKNGKMRGPDGERVNVPTNSEYPMAAIGKYAVENAQIQTAEEQIEDHKNDLLGDKAGPRVSMADQVAKDPAMMDAVKDYSRFLGAGDIDDVFAAMMANGKGTSAAKLMKFMGVTPDDVRDFENQKAKEAKEATTVAKPLTQEAKDEIKARTDLLKVEQETQRTIQGKNKEDSEKMKSEKDHLDAETDKLLADKAGQDGLIDAIGSGHVSPERIGYILAKKPELLEAAVKKYPDISTARLEQYPKKYEEFTSTKPKTAGAQINNGATAFKHLRDLLALNTNMSHIPGTPAYKAYKSQMNTLVDELGQFYGTSTIPGLEGFKETLDSTLPGNREAAIRQQAHSMGVKMDSFVQQWKNAAPSKAFVDPMPYYDDEAQAARQSLTGSTGAQVRTSTAEQNAAKTFKSADGTTYNTDENGVFSAHGAQYKVGPDGKAHKIVTPAPATK